MSQVYLLAKIEAKPNHADSLLSLLENLVRDSRKEDGCITYELLQDKEQPELFVMREQWKSQAILEQHQKTPHFQNFVAKAQELNLLNKLDAKSFEIKA